MIGGFAVNGVAAANDYTGPIIVLGILCCVAVLFFAALALIFISPEKKETVVQNAPAVSPLKVISEIVRMPQFVWILPPNLLRALHFSAIFFFHAIGVQRFPESLTVVGYIAVAIPASGVAGCLVLAWLQPRMGTGLMYLSAAIVETIGVVLVAVSGGELAFAGAFFVLYFGQTAIDYAFPLGIYDIVPPGLVGRFSAVRSHVYMAAVAIFTYTNGLLLENVGPVALYIIGGVALPAGGLCFYAANKKFRGINVENAEA